MNDINEKIDRHVKQGRRNALISGIISLGIVIPILLLTVLPNMGETSQAEGVVIRLIGLPTDEGQNLYLLIKLENGNEIRSFIENSSFYKKGLKVRLEKQEPLFFGRSVYRFRGYFNSE